MADPLLQIQDLSFGWPQTAPLLKGLSLELNPGEIVSLVGASGCGKSTLLNLAAGLLMPQNGQITRNYSRQAMVFQNASLLPWRSCRANVALPLELEGTANANEKAQAALEQLGLGDHGDKLSHSLSGGMQMRAALARALVADPEVLYLDEAFSALDAITRKAILKQFLALQHRIGFGVLLVTHDIDEAILLSDRVHVLKGAPGRLGPPTAIEQPRPRDLEWRHSPELGALSRQIEAEL